MVASSSGHLGEEVLKKAGKAFKKREQGRAGNGVSVYLACVISHKQTFIGQDSEGPSRSVLLATAVTAGTGHSQLF